MSDPSPSAQAMTQTVPSAPAVLHATQLYDLLMKDIEPDLLSDVIPLLQQKYAEESTEEKTSRAMRYQQAFALYEERLAEYKTAWDQQLHRYKRLAVSHLEARSRQKEDAVLEQIDSSFIS